MDEPRTLSAESFAEAKESAKKKEEEEEEELLRASSYSVWAKWIEELTPRGSVPLSNNENVEPEPEQADQAAGPRPSPGAGKGRRSFELTEKKAQLPLESKPALRPPIQGALQPVGQLPVAASPTPEKMPQPVVALATPEKMPLAVEKSEKTAPVPAAKDVLRGRRVLSLHGSMCTLSLLERGGQVRVEAAMRVNGTLIRGTCAVPDAGSDAWAVWARTDVRVLGEQLTVAYT
jgi:hypothetical protein